MNVESGPSVASLRSECGAKYSWAKKPGAVFSSKHYFVLKSADDTLYEFKSDLVSKKTSFNMLDVFLF